MDINEIINLKKLKSVTIYNYDFNIKNIDKDFRYYFTNIFNKKFKFNEKNLNINNIFLLVGTNLRYENPLFNLQFLKNSKNIKKFDIYLSIGPAFHSNFPINFISNNSNYFFKFLKGKTHLNILIKNYINKNYNLNILFGSSFIEILSNKNNLEFIYFQNHLSKLYKKKINICLLLNNLYYLNCFELNLKINNLKTTNFIQNNIYNSIGLILENNLTKFVNLKLLNKFISNNIVNFFFNSHGHKLIKDHNFIFDFLLPNTTFNEKTIYSYNIYGFLLKSEKFNKKFKKSKDFIFLLKFLKKKFKIKDKKSFLDDLILKKIYINYDFINNLDNINSLIKENKFIFLNKPMYSYYDNPYIIDNFTSWSNNLQLASIVYEKELSKNFKNLIIY